MRNALRGYQKLNEAAPDKFMLFQSAELLTKARNAVAKVLNAAAEECVFVPNATTAINLVLRNIVYQPKDVIVYFDTIYGALEKTLASLVESVPNVQVRKVGYGQDYAYSLPCTHAEILNAFSQTLSRLIYDGLQPKVAVFDTIVSVPGVRFPFERLTRMCKEYGMISVIDGAHGVGQIPLNLTTLDADFFVSNCHKWLYTPRGCAVLHIPTRNHHIIRTTFPTSHGFVPNPDLESTKQHFSHIRNVLAATHRGSSQYQTLFQWVATMDYAPYYCVTAAVNFRNNILGGEEVIYQYMRDIAQRGADLAAMILGTEVMDDLDPREGLKTLGSVEGQVVGRNGEGGAKWSGGLRDCAMANVLLPLTIVAGEDSSPVCRGTLSSGPGGAGSAGGLSPFGPMRRSPSPSSKEAHGVGRAVSPVTFAPERLSEDRQSSVQDLAGGQPGHRHSKSSTAALPTAPSRSTTLPIELMSSPPSDRPNGIFPRLGRNMSPHSPFAPHRRSSAPLNVAIRQQDVQKHKDWMQRKLVEEFNTFVPIYEYSGRMWCRVSGQIYLELKDFEWLGNVLRGLCERVGDGESLSPSNMTEAAEVDRGAALAMSGPDSGEVERLRSRLGALDTDADGPLGRVQTENAVSGAPGVRGFDVRVGQWVDK